MPPRTGIGSSTTPWSTCWSRSYERSFIADSYACRKGKGTHAAVNRCQQFARRFRYVLKADIQKFFPSLDHEILKALVARKIKDPDVLWLVGQIIDHSNPQEEVLNYFPGDDLFTPGERRRGIPIGNQTSQFFANVYLDPLDHFVKDRLGIKGYVRYVDDFLVFSDDKQHLADVREQISGLSGLACGCGCTRPRASSSRSRTAFASSATGSFPRTACCPRRTSGGSVAGSGGCRRIMRRVGFPLRKSTSGS